MPSAFFKELDEDYIKVPCIVFEVFEHTLKQHEVVDYDETAYLGFVQDTLKVLGKENDVGTAMRVAKRISQMFQESSDEAKKLEASEAIENKSASPAGEDDYVKFGEQLLEWMQSLKMEEICFYLAGGDTEKARYLYCEEDREVVMAAHRLKMKHEWHIMETHYQAAAFGFNGPPKKSESEGIKLHNEDGSINAAASAELLAIF